MDTISVAAARKADAVGRQVRLQGWIRTRRDSKGGFSFLELNDGSCQGNIQIVADGKLANYESEIKHLTAGCERHRRRRSQGLARKRANHGSSRFESCRARRRRCGNLSAAEKGALFRVPAHHRPFAAAHQYVRRHRPRAKPR